MAIGPFTRLVQTIETLDPFRDSKTTAEYVQEAHDMQQLRVDELEKADEGAKIATAYIIHEDTTQVPEWLGNISSDAVRNAGFDNSNSNVVPISRDEQSINKDKMLERSDGASHARELVAKALEEHSKYPNQIAA